MVVRRRCVEHWLVVESIDRNDVLLGPEPKQVVSVVNTDVGSGAISVVLR